MLCMITILALVTVKSIGDLSLPTRCLGVVCLMCRECLVGGDPVATPTVGCRGDGRCLGGVP